MTVLRTILSVATGAFVGLACGRVLTLPVWAIAAIVTGDVRRSHESTYSLEILCAWLGAVAFPVVLYFYSASDPTVARVSRFWRRLIGLGNRSVAGVRAMIAKRLDARSAALRQRDEEVRLSRQKGAQELRDNVEKLRKEKGAQAEKRRLEDSRSMGREREERQEDLRRQSLERSQRQEDKEIAELTASMQEATPEGRRATFDLLRDELQRAKDDLRLEEGENEKTLREYGFQPHVIAGCAEVTREFTGRIQRIEKKLEAAKKLL